MRAFENIVIGWVYQMLIRQAQLLLQTSQNPQEASLGHDLKLCPDTHTQDGGSPYLTPIPAHSNVVELSPLLGYKKPNLLRP